MDDDFFVEITDKWEKAPPGSRLETDLSTGEQRVLPPTEPVDVQAFLRMRATDGMRSES